MVDIPEDILILDGPVERPVLERLALAHFTEMMKYVVDIERRLVALGGELHADAEELLIAHGSRKGDLWGANYYPGRGPAD